MEGFPWEAILGHPLTLAILGLILVWARLETMRIAQRLDAIRDEAKKAAEAAAVVAANLKARQAKGEPNARHTDPQ